MNKISRKGFIKIAAAAAMSGVTAGALAACNAASGSASASTSGAAGQYIPGTYEGTAEGISSTVKVTMTFSDSAVTDVVVDTSGETASFGAAAADELREQLLAAGSAEIDGVSGSTITSDAVMKAAKSCYAQAKGEAVVSSVQLPTGDENDWLGKEPDIDETAITETVDTDILIVGAGNGGMFAAAYAAANGLNFRVIEQNANVQDTRHWYGAVDSAAAKEAGEPATDKAKLLSEISRYASGKCDQRVVKTWINESAAMHDFMRSILEDKYGWLWKKHLSVFGGFELEVVAGHQCVVLVSDMFLHPCGSFVGVHSDVIAVRGDPVHDSSVIQLFRANRIENFLAVSHVIGDLYSTDLVVQCQCRLQTFRSDSCLFVAVTVCHLNGVVALPHLCDRVVGQLLGVYHVAVIFRLNGKGTVLVLDNLGIGGRYIAPVIGGDQADQCIFRVGILHLDCILGFGEQLPEPEGVTFVCRLCQSVVR